MSKISRNTALFFILIAGLVIFSHGVIPHDHHFNAANDLLDRQNNGTNQNKIPLKHCHFLDFVTVDKVLKKHTVQQVVFQPTLLTAYSYIGHSEQQGSNRHLLLSGVFPELELFAKNTPVRGSPFLIL